VTMCKHSERVFEGKELIQDLHRLLTGQVLALGLEEATAKRFDAVVSSKPEKETAKTS